MPGTPPYWKEQSHCRVMDEVREKVLRLPVERGVSIRTALVYEGKLDPYVEREGYFDFLVPFAHLLTEIS